MSSFSDLYSDLSIDLSFINELTNEVLAVGIVIGMSSLYSSSLSRIYCLPYILNLLYSSPSIMFSLNDSRMTWFLLMMMIKFKFEIPYNGSLESFSLNMPYA